MRRAEFREKLGQFLALEQVAAVILPSRDAPNSGGSGGTIFDDNGSAFGRLVYQKDHANPVPLAVTGIENYGRVQRLLKANVPVTIELNIETKFYDDHEHGFDTVAEIPGTDPKLKDEIVMVGGHLDSWISATGATDNGAGSVVAMEVMRILNALHVKPRRTIRVALWTGEEQGLYGSRGYATQHFGSAPRSTEPDQLKLSEFMRKVTGPLQLKPEQQKMRALLFLLEAFFPLRLFRQQGRNTRPFPRPDPNRDPRQQLAVPCDPWDTGTRNMCSKLRPFHRTRDAGDRRGPARQCSRAGVAQAIAPECGAGGPQ
jgi:hypothetical protein